MWLETWNRYEQQQVQVEKKETSLKQKLDFLSDATWNKKDYENFIKVLENIKDKWKKEQLINFLEKSKDNTKLFNKILDTFDFDWFPWTEQAISDFFEEFWIKVKDTEQKVEDTEQKVEDTEQKVEDTEQKIEDKNNELNLLRQRFEKFLNKNNNREKLEELSLGKEFIKNIEKWNFEEAEKFLKQNWQILFKQIANSPNLDPEEKKELFETTKSFVSSNFPDIQIHSFEYYTWKWEDKPNPSKILETAEGELSDNTVSVDLDHIPPKYDLWRIDSDYKFKNKLDSEQISDLTWEYLDELKNISEAEKSMDTFWKWYNSFLKWLKIVWQENIKDINSWNYEDFKSWLQANINTFKSRINQELENIYSKVDIPDDLKINSQDISDLWNINYPGELEQKVNSFNKKIKELKKYINWLRKQAYDKYKNEIKQKVLEETQEKKEKQKEVLEFLHDTWFDLIPQNITNILISDLKHNVFQINWLNLNLTRLDLENWKFWESVLETWWTKWKENLVKFMNKMIYWEINPQNSPLNPNNFIWVMWASINPTELQSIFEQQWIKSGSMWNINNMRENLRKEN